MAPLPKPKARKWMGLRHTDAGVGSRGSAMLGFLEMLIAASAGNRLAVQPNPVADGYLANHADRPALLRPLRQQGGLRRRQGKQQYVIITAAQHPVQLLGRRPGLQGWRRRQRGAVQLHGHPASASKMGSVLQQPIGYIQSGSGNPSQRRAQLTLGPRPPETVEQVVSGRLAQTPGQLLTEHHRQPSGTVAQRAADTQQITGARTG